MAKTRTIQILVTDEEHAVVYKRMMRECLANNKRPSISSFVHDDYIKPLMNGHNPIDNKQDAEPDSEPVEQLDSKQEGEPASNPFADVNIYGQIGDDIS